MAWGMADTKIQFRLRYGQLWCYATRPEYRHFAFFNANRITVIRLMDMLNSNLGRIAKMHRGTMYLWKARANLNGADRCGRLHWPHTDHHITAKHPSTLARNSGFVHGDIFLLGNITNFQAIGQ